MRHRSERHSALALLGLLAASGGCFSEPSSSTASAGEIGTIEPEESSGTADDAASFEPTTESGPAEESTQDDSSGDVAIESSEGGADESSGGDPTDDGADASDESSTDGGESSTGEPPPLGVDELMAGDLVITEVMWNPTCGGDSCEWIEILNATPFSVNLLDLYVQDDEYSIANQGRVTNDVIVGPGELVVIARGASDWPYEFDAAAIYGPNPGLNNNDPDRVSIRSATGLIDETPWFPFDEEDGIAWALSGNTLDAVSNDNSGNWCMATTLLAHEFTDEFGTPGVLNESC